MVAVLATAVTMTGIAPVALLAASEAVKPEVALKNAFPQLTVDSIGPSEVKGLYEVVSGSNIFYYNQEKDIIIVGDMVNRDLKSLTQERKSELATRMIKELPLEKAVKIGSGKNIVIEFTDPDCPYCRKASDFLRTKSDMTRYIFFAPLAHPAAISKIHYILNVADKGKAYEEMMQGKSPTEPAGGYGDTIKALAQEHLSLARKVGVTGTPTFFINGKQVVGADSAKIDELLKAQGNTK
jgi:thiol:disulfide interchange protein DsbC